MTKLMEIFMRYKMIMLLLFLLLIGCGAFYLGQSSASPADSVEATVVEQKAGGTNKKSTETSEAKAANEAADKANAKTEADIEKMAKQLDEHKKEIENDNTVGTKENGTVKMAPPKFSAPKDLKTRQADFKD